MARSTKVSAPPRPNLALKRLRENRGLTQKDLAEKIGITGKEGKNLIYRWEHGVQAPSAFYQRALMKYFECSLAELGLSSSASEPPAPAPLPALATPPTLSPEGLVGRDHLFEQIKRRLLSGGSTALSALNGIPGVGKTALALAVANDAEVKAHFSDGILWAGLGRTPNVLQSLAAWGAALGLQPSELERLASPNRLSHAIQAALHMRRMLLVVDDAWSVVDALAFQLGGPACGHLATTRLPEVAALFAGDGAVTVGELPHDDGVALLGRLAPEVVATASAEAHHLVEAVGGLPLAITILGRYLRAEAYTGQPRRLHEALTRLGVPRERVNLATPRVPRDPPNDLPLETPVALQTVIGLSDERLDPDAQALLRALGVFPPKPNTFAEVAALAVGAALPATLDALQDAGLVETAGAGRYSIHQTISDYASLHATDPAPAARLAAFYADFLTAHQDDFSALDPDAANIAAALDAAYDRDLTAPLVEGAHRFAPFLEARGRYDDAQRYLERARTVAERAGGALSTRLAPVLLHLGRVAELRSEMEAAELLYHEGVALARAAGDRRTECEILAHWGEVVDNRGDSERSERLLQEGLAIARELGDTARTGVLLRILGETASSQGRRVEGEDLYHQALAASRGAGDIENVCACLQDLAANASVRGDGSAAVAYLAEGLDLARSIGHRQRTSGLLLNLGLIELLDGRYDEAERSLEESLALGRALANPIRTSSALQNLGMLARLRGEAARAEAHFSESLALAREVGLLWLQSETLSEWGELALQRGESARAETMFREALEIAGEVRGVELIALAHFGLARALALQGEHAEAMRHAIESRQLFRAERHRRTAQVESWLRTHEPLDT